MSHYVLSFGAVGLVYDVCGVIALGYAFFSKTNRTVKAESEMRWDFNSELVTALVTTRTDGVFGSSLLIVGFALQFIAQLHMQGPGIVGVLYFVLAIIMVAYWYWLRARFISKQCATVIALHKAK